MDLRAPERRRPDALEWRRRRAYRAHAEPIDLRWSRQIRSAGTLLVGRRRPMEIVAGPRLEEGLLVVADLVGQDWLGVVDEQELLLVIEPADVLLRQDVALLLRL